LKCLRAGGAIFFHDTKFPHITELANKLLENKWVNFEIGAGVGLYTRNQNGEIRMENTELSQDEIKNLYETSMAQRWDYLASDEFRIRNQVIKQKLGKYLSTFEEISALEIGGNPAPLLPEILSLGSFTELTTVEPYISPKVKYIFEEMQRKGINISKVLSEVAHKKPNLVILLGVDLSLAKDFSELKADVQTIRSLFWKAKIVVTETPNYQPSKWLETFLTQGLTLIESEKIVINTNEKFSITKDIQTRVVSIWSVPIEKSSEISNWNLLQSEIIKYARWHAMDGAPSEMLHFGESGYEVQQTFSAWQVEFDPTGKSFVWLKSRQLLTFPSGKRKLTIRFCQGPVPIIAHSWLFKSEINGNEILIVRRSFFKRLKFEIKGWVPSAIDPESCDHRELTIAVNSFEFI